MVCLSKQHDFCSEQHVQEKTPYIPKFRYQRDPIGNRITSTTTETGSPVIRNYTSNNLNQYTAIDNPASAPAYNDDGCMLNDGTWTFTWDGENRMASATNGSQTLEFKYDYMGRRVEKTVTGVSSERFVYDGYLQIEKLNALDSNAILNKRIWGAEEKIIADIHPSGTYYALGDANKNITEYLDASGTIEGHYEFSPFGKITVATGSNPDAFDFRFSSEYFDVETGLVYYNFRYYSPELGRWMSRDPIEENGGENLYGMLGNETINRFDTLGLSDGESCPICCGGKPYDPSSEGCCDGEIYTLGTHCCCMGETVTCIQDILDEKYTIKRLAQKWNRTENPGWSPGNQCEPQADNCRAAAMAGTETVYTYWDLKITTKSKSSIPAQIIRGGIVQRHNAIRVISKCGFDCPKNFILDPFKRIDREKWRNDVVEEYTEKEFSDEFPYSDLTGVRDW